jgi:hypothetical protein
MRSENEIGKRLKLLKQNKVTGGPYSELKTIAWNATKQALKWVLEESDELLTY